MFARVFYFVANKDMTQNNFHLIGDHSGFVKNNTSHKLNESVLINGIFFFFPAQVEEKIMDSPCYLHCYNKYKIPAQD